MKRGRGADAYTPTVLPVQTSHIRTGSYHMTCTRAHTILKSHLPRSQRPDRQSTFALSRSRAKPKNPFAVCARSRSRPSRLPSPAPRPFLPYYSSPSPRHPNPTFLPQIVSHPQSKNRQFPSRRATMPTLRSATANASPVAVGTPSPAAASTPRSVKRRLTPGRAGELPAASRHTSPHRSPHAGTGTVRSTAYWTLM